MRRTRSADVVRDVVGLALERVAGLGHRERARVGGAALLDDVRELVGDQPVAVGRAGGVGALGEVDVGARRERARGHRAVELVGRVVGVDRDVGEVAERAGQAGLRARVEAGATAARVVDLRLYLRVDLAGVQDPGAVAREHVAEAVVADVGGELVQRLLGLLRSGVRRLDPMVELVLLLMLGAPAHAASIRPRRRRPQGPDGQSVVPREYSYHRMSTGGQRRASLPETVGAWLRVWTPPRDVDVPDVPVRKLVIGGGGGGGVLAPPAAVLAPRGGPPQEPPAGAARGGEGAQRAGRPGGP